MSGARRLVVATRNPGKVVELARLVALPGLQLVAIEVVDPAMPDVIEDADSFEGNAIKKAREVSDATGWPALADDSGLEVDALGGAPGVYSARFHQLSADGSVSSALRQVAILKPELQTAANNRKLLAALADVPAPERTARFRAVLAFADVDGALGTEVITADGVCEGTILDAPRGQGGFGYDPLFVVAGGERTMAELDHDAKNAISHRGRAMRAIESQLRVYLAT